MRHKRVSKLHNDGLSPNGKALDSDSSIFQVRILVAQFIRRSRFDRLFYFELRAPFILRIIYATESSADALSLGSIHNGTKFAAAKLLPLIKCRCISTVCLSICCIYHPYLLFGCSHINYKIIDRISRLICHIYTKNSFPINWKALSYAAEKIRTPDTLVRSQVLYPAELRPHLCCVSQQMIFYRSFN